MHAQLPSLAGHPAPFMQANTTPMPTHPPVVDAPELQPGTIARSLHMAWMLQMELVGCRRSLTATKRPIHPNASQRFLDLMATAGSGVILDSRRHKDMVPVICIPSHSQSSLHQLPPPFLARFQGINNWKMLWKTPSFPWSSLLHQWVMVDWYANELGRFLVLGLRASGSTDPAAHGPSSLHTPQALSASPRPPPYTPHQQGQGAQLAATARQMPVTACEATTPPVATPAPPSGPGPKEGRQDCSVHAPAIMQAQLACSSGTAPGTQVVAADINAAAPVVATGPGAEQSTAAAEWKDVDESSIRKWLCKLPGMLEWQLGLRHAPVALQTTVLVQLLVEEPASLNAFGTEKAPHLDCVASHDASNNWTLCAKTSPKTSTTVTAWVARLGMQLTGRYKVARVWSDEAPPCLVLEIFVRPAVMGQGHPSLLRAREVLLLRLGPGHPSPLLHQDLLPLGSQRFLNLMPPLICWPGALFSGPEGTAVPNSVAGFKRNVSDTVQGNAKRQCGSQGHSPSLAAGVAQPGGATAAAGLGTAEEGGPGPSQPAAGMAGALDEDDPEVSQPAAAPAHAVGDLPVTWTRPAPGEGQAIDVIEVIDLTQDEPGGAAAAAGLGTAEEGGPGPSQPAAGAPDEDDPEVSQPAAAPAHAGVEGAGGCSLGASHDGLLSDAAAPPCQASVEDGTAQQLQAALLSPPGTPDTGSTASLHSRPATLASCPVPCLALGGNSASSPEPAGGQQDGALSSDAEEVALPLSGAGLAAGPLPLPSWVSDMVNRANEVQLRLQHNPANWDRAPEPTSDDASHYLLSFISQPALAVDWEKQTMEFVIPVVCVPHDGLPSQHQLPPPFLIRSTQDHQLAVVWQPPDWPWSSVQQHWERVVWTALTQGHMVVGLKAGGNACHEAVQRHHHHDITIVTIATGSASAIITFASASAIIDIATIAITAIAITLYMTVLIQALGPYLAPSSRSPPLPYISCRLAPSLL
ncbi:hypothetical protein QJQ45_006245 [Haematococcus lacustris]|nr:hypothetical protein QJQ45_006245 [Haematococcus lacustris]